MEIEQYVIKCYCMTLRGGYICILYYNLVETRSWDGKKTTRLMLDRAGDESEWKWNLQA